MVLALTLLLGLPAAGCAAELVRVTLRRMLSGAADAATAHNSQPATRTR